MTKRKFTRLFAVVALTTSVPAVHANPARQARPQTITTVVPATPVAPTTPDPRVRPPAAGQRPIAPPPTPAALVESVFALLGVSVPRQLRTGAPACGNVATRMARPADCRRR